MKGWDERTRIIDALRGRVDVVCLTQIGEVLPALGREIRGVAGIILEPTDRDGRAVTSVVRELRQKLPDVPVLGYCRPGVEHSSSIRDLAAAGAHELIFYGVDDSGIALRSALADAGHACAAETVMGRLSKILPESLHPFAAFCLRHPLNAHTVSEVADGLGLNRRTLVNYCTRGSLMPPAELLSWCRLLAAAHYLGTTMRTVESIALQLDFPSDTALRNLMKRYTGLRAKEIRVAGGTSVVLERLQCRIITHQASEAAEMMVWSRPD